MLKSSLVEEKKVRKIRSQRAQEQEDHPGDIKTPQRRFKITLNTMWTLKTGWGKPYFLHESISQPEFLFLSIPDVFVSLFTPGTERGVWKQFKQLANAECFSTLRGGNGATDRWKTAKTKPTQAPFCQRLVWPPEGFWRKSQQLLSGCGRSLSDPVCCTSGSAILILYCLCGVYCSKWNQEFFRLSVLCFLWRDAVERLRRVQRVSAYTKQTTNLYCNNILGLFGRWLGAFLLHRVFVTILYTILASAAKSNQSYSMRILYKIIAIALFITKTPECGLLLVKMK